MCYAAHINDPKLGIALSCPFFFQCWWYSVVAVATIHGWQKKGGQWLWVLIEVRKGEKGKRGVQKDLVGGDEVTVGAGGCG